MNEPEHARWVVAVAAVAAALLPALALFAFWPDPSPSIPSVDTSVDTSIDGDEPLIGPVDEQLGGTVVAPLVGNESLLDIYRSSQFDYDECKQDFADAAAEPTSERLPFYFC